MSSSSNRFLGLPSRPPASVQAGPVRGGMDDAPFMRSADINCSCPGRPAMRGEQAILATRLQLLSLTVCPWRRVRPTPREGHHASAECGLWGSSPLSRIDRRLCGTAAWAGRAASRQVTWYSHKWHISAEASRKVHRGAERAACAPQHNPRLHRRETGQGDAEGRVSPRTSKHGHLAACPRLERNLNSRLHRSTVEVSGSRFHGDSGCVRRRVDAKLRSCTHAALTVHGAKEAKSTGTAGLRLCGSTRPHAGIVDGFALRRGRAGTSMRLCARSGAPMVAGLPDTTIQ